MNRINKGPVDSNVLPFPHRRALVVDRNRKDLWYYSTLLRRMGFEVIPFTNYQEAARCLDGESVDLVFVDQGSTDFEARPVVQHALADGRHTPVVVLAPRLNMGCLLEATHLGAVEYVEKPLAPFEVEDLVSVHLPPHSSSVRHQAGKGSDDLLTPLVNSSIRGNET